MRDILYGRKRGLGNSVTAVAQPQFPRSRCGAENFPENFSRITPTSLAERWIVVFIAQGIVQGVPAEL